jgi:hypothetical protein
LASLRGVAGLQLTPAGEWNPNAQEATSGALGYLVTSQNECYRMEADGPKIDVAREQEIGDAWLAALNGTVEAYGEWGNVERTLVNEVPLLANQFPDLAALVVFPRFSPQMILALAAQGRTVPAGITRFVISGRILRLNAPLAQLAVDEPLAAKQAWLDNLIREKLRGRQVRYYEEPVVLLDE